MINQNKLFKNLMSLCEDEERNKYTFFFKDYTLDDKIYRIFNYGLASYTDFHDKEDALNCRGTMFDITSIHNPRLVCLPPQKFFNYEQGGVNHTQNRLIQAMVKLDGSLISSYIHNGELRLKSKGALESFQAIEAMKLLDSMPTVKQWVYEITDCNHTMNFEYTSSKNQVVEKYEHDQLRLLSTRDNETGKLSTQNCVTLLSLQDEEFIEENDSLSFTIVKDNMEFFDGRSITEIVENIRKEQTGEGYVLNFKKPDGTQYLVKVKTDRYCNLHNILGDIQNPRRIFEYIINEEIDDIKGLFGDKHPALIEAIENMEKKILPIYNKMIHDVDKFYADNKNLDRKEYALKALTDYKLLMPLLMSLYIGRTNDYKEFAIKNYSMFVD